MYLKNLRRPARIPHNAFAARPHLYLGRTRLSSWPAMTDGQLLDGGNAAMVNEWGTPERVNLGGLSPGSSGLRSK